MGIDCPEWSDFFHGGLQFQAIHHLFLRVPRVITSGQLKSRCCGFAVRLAFRMRCMGCGWESEGGGELGRG